ncbi:MAG: sigma 54-interacting transcriptional regulator [Candidatus Rokubacteria bacterium]|nr:sigma 54-interacting transcriptional regulator [Candidatus Rokubacteria bacterium]
MKILDELIGKSPAIEELREKIRQLLRRRLGGRLFPPLLIQGETGTGKGLIAKLIHQAGPRAEGPFVPVNCAAIPETLLEAELFGFERGAFTDARQAKPGLFQAAHRGTIFLDEIGLLPEGLQAKLLKVLEERTVRRLGSTRSEPVDVWILTATNEDLAVATRLKRFREDLYHRLAVLTLSVPPLRERGEDILLLAERHLERACREYTLAPKSFAEDARRALAGYRWPGNVRELGNVIERVALLSEEPVVTAEMLALPSVAAPERLERAPDGAARPLEDVVGEAERQHLLEVLRETAWNISRTAVRLGISRNTLRYRLEKHRLQREGASPRGRPAPRPAAAAPAPALPVPAALPPAPASVRWERRRLTLLRATVAPDGPDSPLYTSRAIQALVDKAQSFGGRVEELGSAGIVAAFGLEPVEDASRRAAHAAMAMQKAGERSRREDADPLAVRIAIHVGQFLVAQSAGGAQIDPEAKREAWTVLDDLCAGAEPNTIVVSEAAAPLLERRFHLDASAAGRAFRLVGQERPGLGLGRHMARFVGRDQDLSLLQSRVAAAMRGNGQAVGIVGEAGIGKSRLVFELRQALRGENVTYLRGRCLSYGAAIPYLPVLDILRQTCRITEADSHARIAEKVAGTLRQMDMDPDEWAPYLLQLFGVKEGTERLAVLSDEAIKARILETLRRMILNASRQQPLIFVAEDLHWVDKSSEDCLAFLVEHIAGSPILLLTTYRPGYRPPWMNRSYATQIALQPLSPQDSLELVRSVLPASPLSEHLAQLILEKAEGNPFFLEEMTRAVGEQRGSKPAPAVPDTIQEVLLARIDRLPEKTKRLLQTASVLRREFSRRILGAIWQEPLDPHLEELTRLEFLHEQSRGGDPVYVFKHALLQDVAYESLTDAERQELHAAAARALETLYAGRLEETQNNLAYHYSKAQEGAKAIEYLTRSAERAARSYAHEEAVRALREAVAHVERLPAEERDHRLLDLLLRQAASLIALGRLQEVLDLLLPQQERLERLEERVLAGRYYFLLGRTYGFLGQQEPTARSAQRAIAESKQCRDEATMGKAYSLLSMQSALSGQARQGIEHGRQAIALLERTDERWWLGQAYWMVGLNYTQMGEFEAALEAEGRAHAIGEDLGDPRLQTFAAWVSGMIYAAIGEFDAGIASCERALRTAPDPFERAIAAGCLGYAYLEKGDTARATPVLERAVQQLAQFRYRPFQGWFSVFLAEANRLERRFDRAADLAMQALVISREADFRPGVGWAQQALGRIASARGMHADAETHFNAARDTFIAVHSRYELGRTYLDLAALARAQGHRDAVAANLLAAHRLFRLLKVDNYVGLTVRLARQVGVTLAEDAGSR